PGQSHRQAVVYNNGGGQRVSGEIFRQERIQITGVESRPRAYDGVKRHLSCIRANGTSRPDCLMPAGDGGKLTEFQRVICGPAKVLVITDPFQPAILAEANPVSGYQWGSGQDSPKVEATRYACGHVDIPAVDNF